MVQNCFFYRRWQPEGRPALRQLRYHRQTAKGGGLRDALLCRERRPSPRPSTYLEERDLEVKGSCEDEMPLGTAGMIEKMRRGEAVGEGAEKKVNAGAMSINKLVEGTRCT